MEECLLIVPDVKGDDGVFDYMAQRKKVALEGEVFDSAIIVFSDYAPNEFCICITGHHVKADGLQTMRALYLLSDNLERDKNSSPFSKLKTPSLTNWIMILLTLPYSVFMNLSHYFERPFDRNCIKNHPHFMTGRLRARNALEISTEAARNLCKNQGFKLSELTAGLVSQTLSQYFEEKGEQARHVTVSLPVSMGNIDTNFGATAKLGNCFVSLSAYMPLDSDLTQATLKHRKSLSIFDNKLMVPGMYALIYLQNLLLSRHLVQGILREAGKKHSLLLSYIPGFLAPVHFAGGRARKVFGFGVGAGNMATAVLVMSTSEVMQLSVNSDESQIEDIDLFVRLLDKNIRKANIHIKK
uniref:O-acyltransferase WSD1 C-terminal domain-containing protein n=1 Tax=Strombidium rassoulzadegani TaxID=1082188 RepID=A0A7S3CMV8_9SPIT|mmetsp:Transcript_17498/g.29467  ORF Transcript_17498/g.29467 Transcript_17498/m.29467 type:complete len:355 (+) Transcript_17498:602-1666(+)